LVAINNTVAWANQRLRRVNRAGCRAPTQFG